MMQTWFESKVKYNKVSETGNDQIVTENFLLDAVSYTDAETRTIRKMQEMVRGGEFQIVDIKKSRIAEVFTVDEDAGKEKKLRTYYLIMADDIKEALQRLDESLEFLVIPYVVSALAVSPIVDVFPYEASESAIPSGYVPLDKESREDNPIFTDGINPFEEDAATKAEESNDASDANMEAEAAPSTENDTAEAGEDTEEE